MRTRLVKKDKRKWRKRRRHPPTKRREGREREDGLRAASHGEERRAAAGSLDFLARRGRMVEEAAEADAIDGDLIVGGEGLCSFGGELLELLRRNHSSILGTPLCLQSR